jgi:hypothetical protein
MHEWIIVAVTEIRPKADGNGEKTRCNGQRVRSTCDAENIQTTPRLFYRRSFAALEALRISLQ